MTPADILTSLFPAGHQVRLGQGEQAGSLHGNATLPDGLLIHVLGVVDGVPLGIEGAIRLAGQVLAIASTPGTAPILLMVDSGSQRMSRRDELLGISEYLAHLAKALQLAEQTGHRAIGLLYGHTAAGAFIASALAAGTLVALPGANPEVMDLPSIARVTKLPLETLQRMAQSTPVFAPGLDNLMQTGAVLAVWDDTKPLAAQLAALLATPAGPDVRDRLGAARAGRPKAADIAARVQACVRQLGQAG